MELQGRKRRRPKRTWLESGREDFKEKGLLGKKCMTDMQVISS